MVSYTLSGILQRQSYGCGRRKAVVNQYLDLGCIFYRLSSPSHAGAINILNLKKDRTSGDTLAHAHTHTRAHTHTHTHTHTQQKAKRATDDPFNTLQRHRPMCRLTLYGLTLLTHGKSKAFKRRYSLHKDINLWVAESYSPRGEHTTHGVFRQN